MHVEALLTQTDMFRGVESGILVQLSAASMVCEPGAGDLLFLKDILVLSFFLKQAELLEWEGARSKGANTDWEPHLEQP